MALIESVQQAQGHANNFIIICDVCVVRPADLGFVRELSLFRGFPRSLYSIRSPDILKFLFQTLRGGESGFLGHTTFERGKISNFA